MRGFLLSWIVCMGDKGVIERLAIYVLRMRREMAADTRRQVTVLGIGHHPILDPTPVPRGALRVATSASACNPSGAQEPLAEFARHPGVWARVSLRHARRGDACEHVADYVQPGLPLVVGAHD